MGVKLTTDSIRVIAAFEKIAKVHAKDCLVTDSCVYFLVEAEKMGLAIGKNGAVVKEISRILGRPVKVFGYSKDLEKTVKSMMPHAKSIDINGSTITVTVQPSDKTSIIGKGGNNIKAMRELLERHFKVKNLRLK